MKLEDREALRIFYRELARQSFKQEQVALYFALKGGKQARVEWVKQNAAKLNIPADVVAILQSMDDCTRGDLAIIAAAEIAPIVAPEVQKAVDSIWSWRWWPWNWGRKS